MTYLQVLSNISDLFIFFNGNKQIRPILIGKKIILNSSPFRPPSQIKKTLVWIILCWFSLKKCAQTDLYGNVIENYLNVIVVSRLTFAQIQAVVHMGSRLLRPKY